MTWNPWKRAREAEAERDRARWMECMAGIDAAGVYRDLADSQLEAANLRTERDAAQQEAARAIHRLTEALRLTVEYVGQGALPAIEGWSWWDAMVEYAPDVAAQMVTVPESGVAENLNFAPAWAAPRMVTLAPPEGESGPALDVPERVWDDVTSSWTDATEATS